MRGSDELNEEDKKREIIKAQSNLSQSSRVQPNEEIDTSTLHQRTAILYNFISTMRSSHVENSEATEVIHSYVQLDKHVNNVYILKQLCHLCMYPSGFPHHLHMYYTLLPHFVNLHFRGNFSNNQLIVYLLWYCLFVLVLFLFFCLFAVCFWWLVQVNGRLTAPWRRTQLIGWCKWQAWRIRPAA